MRETQTFEKHSTERTDGPSDYVLRQASRSAKGREDLEAIGETTTLYVGNLSFFTTMEQIYELFSKVGRLKRVIMGLDRFNRTPCGFCFVEYTTHEEALQCVRYLNHTKLDDRVIRVDLDPGFEEGRQYGRGASGGQVRDEYREDYDPGRGGYGKRLTQSRSHVAYDRV